MPTKEYYWKHKGELNRKKKIYDATHVEQIREYNKNRRPKITPQAYKKHSEWTKKWLKANPNIRKKYKTNYQTKFPEKHKAVKKVWYALKIGKLIRESCKFCGAIKSHAHHEDYSKPLEVIWVCPQHHKDIHMGKIKL